MKCRTGNLYNQKHAVWFKHSMISLTFPLCPQLDNALHILSGYQHTQIKNMITERHDLACSMIFKAISMTGSLGSFFVCIDIGSNERMTMQNLQIPETVESKIVPKWLFPPRFPHKDRFFFFFWWGLLHGPQQGPDRMKEKTYKTGKRKTPA